MSRRRILFVSEAVTLAQVVRLHTLALALPADRYEIGFASASFDSLVFGSGRGVDEGAWRRFPIPSVSPESVRRAVAWGLRPYGYRTLANYVKSELSLIESFGPDLIVGDLRWSLAVSADVQRVKYFPLINAYWSPRAVRSAFPVPDHPAVAWVGLDRMQQYFSAARPWAFRYFAAPVNRLRRHYGLAPLGDLAEMLMFGDQVLFPDCEELVPLESRRQNEVFLGPVFWSPGNGVGKAPVPESGRLIYFTLGSSGRVAEAERMIAELAGLDAEVWVATAGRYRPRFAHPRVRYFDFLDGDAACRQASLVVSNGGSTTSYQALRWGTPVLGICHNLDQYLAMQAIERFGAGLSLRSAPLAPGQVAGAAATILSDPAFSGSSARARDVFRNYDSSAAFRRIVGQALWPITRGVEEPRR